MYNLYTYNIITTATFNLIIKNKPCHIYIYTHMSDVCFMTFFISKSMDLLNFIHKLHKLMNTQ